MMLTITSIERAEPALNDGGVAESAALAVYGLLMEQLPELRTERAQGIVHAAHFACNEDTALAFQTGLAVQTLIAAQLPEHREKCARGCLEWAQIACGITPFPYQPIPERA